MKKVLFSAALLMAAATVSFAGNPKGETKAEAKTEVKAKTTHTYYVVSFNSTTQQYTLGASPTQPCTGAASPCEIQSEDELPNPIDKTVVDQEQGLDIITRQAQL